LLPVHCARNIRARRAAATGFHVAAKPPRRKLARMSQQIFSHAHRVTYAECTIGDHIYYSRYLDLLEEARGEFFRHLGLTFRELHEAGAIFPVIEAHLRYKGAARYDDVLRIELWVDDLARVRLAFGARILNQRGELLVEAQTVHACTSTDDKLKRLPPELAARLQPFVRPPA
jgi:acyl-CoA thioester hydrolase